MASIPDQSQPLLNRKIAVLGCFRKVGTTQKEIRKMISDLGGSTSRFAGKSPPTDLIWGSPTRDCKRNKIEEPPPVCEARSLGVPIRDYEWLQELLRRKKDEECNEPLVSADRTRSSIVIPDGQPRSVLSLPQDMTVGGVTGCERIWSPEDPSGASSSHYSSLRDTPLFNSVGRVDTSPLVQYCARRQVRVEVQHRVAKASEMYSGGKVATGSPVRIRQVYANVVHDPRYEDKDGRYLAVPGEDLTERFQIKRVLGEGGFGRVFEAHDRKLKKMVAIKIARSGQDSRAYARHEVRVLETLKRNDDKNHNRFIDMYHLFEHRGHICIVMDLLRTSVHDFIKDKKHTPFPYSYIHSFAEQLFSAASFMHGLNLIHADIKPDNIMLCNYTLSELDCNRRISFSSSTKAGGLGKRRALRNTEIRLIDFGTATFLDESYSAPVGTMAYCAPEALLGLQASFARDIWSIGCVLVELLTGRVLFEVSGLPDPRPNHMPDYLAMIEKISGSQIDDQVTRIVDVKSKAILSNFTSYAMQVSREKVNAVEISLDKFITGDDDFLINLKDLLKRIFVLDPAHRITAKQALKHRWITTPAPLDDGTRYHNR